jgi:hypothetical protein
MTRRDIRNKCCNKAAAIAAYKRRRLDDMLRRERERRHIMGKAEFRERLLIDLAVRKL